MSEPSKEWVDRFIAALEEKRKHMENVAQGQSTMEAKLLSWSMAGIFEGIKECAARAQMQMRGEEKP